MLGSKTHYYSTVNNASMPRILCMHWRGSLLSLSRLILSGLLATSTALAANAPPTQDQGEQIFEDINQLRDILEKKVIAHYQSQNIVTPEATLTAKASNLDNRLKLTRCSTPKTIKVNAHQKYSSTVSVRIRCEGKSPWSIFVPVQVEMKLPIAIAVTDIQKGHILNPGDIAIEIRSIRSHRFGFSDNKEDLVGQAATRHITSGTVIQKLHLAKPIAVKRGDRLKLQANRGSLSVTTSAIAMSKGRVGERIRVKNPQSNKIIEAMITAPGHAVASL